MFVKTISNDNENYDICFVQRLNTTVETLISDWLERHLNCKRVMIVTDSYVAEVQNHALVEIELYLKMHHSIEVTIYIVPEGEQSKSLLEAERLWNGMAESHFSRSDLLIAFGGGMIGDLVGFCASTYLRGVAFIQVPTTLLSQIDSSVGGKVAVNLPYGKNLVGQFYNPEQVIIDVNYLSTLKESRLQDGMGELIKYAFMGHWPLIDWLLSHENMSSVRSSLTMTPMAMEQVVQMCLEIKRVIVEKDFKEVQERKYLNFGHTIGHAIERAATYSIGHGYCVVLGMWIVGDIGWCICSDQYAETYDKIVFDKLEVGYKHFKNIMSEVMHRFGFDMQVPIKHEAWMPYLIQDKKRILTDIQMILPRFESWADPQRKSVINDDEILSTLEYYLDIVNVPIATLERYLTQIGL